MDILIIIGLILLNGIFSMSEIAIISTRKSSLSADAKNGSKRAQVALKLAENPNRFLSTVQVGITLIGILTGIYSGDVLAGSFGNVLIKIGFPMSYAHITAQVSIVMIVTFFTIIFGELIPKRIGMSSAKKISKIIAQPMYFLSLIASPFVWALSKTTSFVFNLLGIKMTDTAVTEEEIKIMLQEGAKGGEVQPVEQDIVERVFNLGDRDIETIMTHRSDIVWIDVDMSRDEIIKLVNSHSFNRYPVAKNSLEDLKGMVYLRDMFGGINDDDFDLQHFINPVSYFPENMKVYNALEEMRHKQLQEAFVCDEFGSVQGILSLKNVLEALVGTMLNPNEDSEITERYDGTYLLDGQCLFYNFLSYFKITSLSSHYEYNTVSGLIIDLLNHIPQTGERVEWKNFIFEVVDMDGMRIDKILVTIK